MIKVTVCRNKEGCISKVSLSGHAGFAEEGSDIVCAAVSMLVLNTVNAIEEFTDTGFRCEADEGMGGFLEISFSDISEDADHDACLLLKCMAKGLLDLEQEYGDYLILNNILE